MSDTLEEELDNTDDVTPIQKLRSGDVTTENLEKVMSAMYLSKNKRSQAPSRTRNSRTGKVVYKDTGSLPSQQMSGDPFGMLAGGEYLEPEFNPEIWAATVQNNTRLGRSIRTYARNTLGLGWHIEPKVKITKEADSETVEEVREQMKVLEALFSNPNDEMPTTSVFYNAKIDEETTGNGYIEVVRNKFGIITNIYHVPAITIRKRVMDIDGEKEIRGFIQIQGNDKVYFKEFGDPEHMSASTGAYVEDIGSLDEDDIATEIIHFKLYTPTNNWYGAPRYVSAAPAITGNRFAAIRNVKFFENDAVPRMLISVSGGKFSADVLQQIEDFFNASSRGLEKSHNSLVLQTEPTNLGALSKDNSTPVVDVRPITVGVTEDASFQVYREANDEEIRECFGIGQVFFTSDATNRASAATSREITNEQEFEPDRLEKEYLINQKLIPAILQKESADILVQFRFERMQLTDPLDMARRDQTYAALGALTPNELRESIGRDSYPEDYIFANKPIQVAMAEMTLKQSEVIKGDWENEEVYQRKMGKLQAEMQQQQQPEPGGGMGLDGGGEDMDGLDQMGLDDLFAGIDEDPGDETMKEFDPSQEPSEQESQEDGNVPQSYGTMELMKALQGLSAEDHLLASQLLKTICRTGG